MSGAVLSLARTFLRAYVVDGVPGSGLNLPAKSDGLNVFAQIAAALADLALFSATGVVMATLAELQGDTGAAPGTPGLVYDDPIPTNNGVWVASGAPAAWANTGIALPSSFAAMLAAVAAGVPWYESSWAQVAQLKVQLQLDGVFATVEAAIPADPTQPANAWWTSGGIVTSGGPLATAIAAALGYTPAQMTALFAAAATVAF